MGKIKNNLINGKEHLYPAIAILIILISAFLTLPNRYLWEPDETRFAEIAREMLTTHQWWGLHLNGEVYTQKPPLYIWILAGLRKIGLSWTAAGVLPSLAALTGIFLLLPNFGRVLGITEKDSYFPSLILASFPLMVIMGLAARMDMLLNFFYFSSFFFWRNFSNQPIPAKRRKLLIWDSG